MKQEALRIAWAAWKKGYDGSWSKCLRWGWREARLIGVTIPTIELEYKLSNGAWMQEDPENYRYMWAQMLRWNGVLDGNVVPKCVDGAKSASIDDLIEALDSGNALRTEQGDWFSVCRKAVPKMSEAEHDAMFARMVRAEYDPAPEDRWADC